METMELEFADQLTVDDGTIVTIRPIRPEDAEIEARFVRLLSPESRRLRFMHALKELTPSLLHRLTHPDPPREVALIAVVDDADGEREIAVARYARTEVPTRAEFAIVVADEWQGRGIATRLMKDLLRIADANGFEEIIGITLADNTRMLQFTRSLGFEHRTSREDASLIELRKAL